MKTKIREMVQLVIKLQGDLQEWAIIELQGFLENTPDIELSGVHIGDLHYEHGRTPTLVIGHYVLQVCWSLYAVDPCR